MPLSKKIGIDVFYHLYGKGITGYTTRSDEGTAINAGVRG
jgi:hypothetical protein